MPVVDYYIGLMSGTSLDGVDAVLASFPFDNTAAQAAVLSHVYHAFPLDLRAQLLALQTPGQDDLHHAALLANQLADVYALAVKALLQQAGLTAEQVTAIGQHGQTIRHRPECGYTLQIGNAARLAEQTNISVVADFRSRDIAAGGQGAPLVPAFHAALFSAPDSRRVLLNIGGIANLTRLHPDLPVIGFDTGTGNMLMDAWIGLHQGMSYDADGAWAASGVCHAGLLQQLCSHGYFVQIPPKSTGRDWFDLAWLQQQLQQLDEAIAPVDVQATLLHFTVQTIVLALQEYCPATDTLYLCGGGAKNSQLVQQLRLALPQLEIVTSEALQVSVDCMEAFAFAWLAMRCIHRQTANLPEVTGAKARRILGAIYPA